jgi:hypothetical protein
MAGSVRNVMSSMLDASATATDGNPFPASHAATRGGSGRPDGVKKMTADRLRTGPVVLASCGSTAS